MPRLRCLHEQIQAFQREDSAFNARFEIAFGKANGTVALGLGSRSLMARAGQQPYFTGAVAGAIGAALAPAPGGVLVQSADGEVIGAIGITGDTAPAPGRVLGRHR